MRYNAKEGRGGEADNQHETYSCTHPGTQRKKDMQIECPKVHAERLVVLRSANWSRWCGQGPGDWCRVTSEGLLRTRYAIGCHSERATHLGRYGVILRRVWLRALRARRVCWSRSGRLLVQ